jgi:hypothetical protein
VDDNNGDTALNEKLALFPKVRLLVNEAREGLAQSKNIGGKAASSPSSVLVFLEAQVVVNRCWLEPLLQQLIRNPMGVALPTTDELHSPP